MNALNAQEAAVLKEILRQEFKRWDDLAKLYDRGDCPEFTPNEYLLWKRTRNSITRIRHKLFPQQ